MKYLIIIINVLALIFILSSCTPCPNKLKRDIYYIKAKVIGEPDTIRVGEKITFQYILYKDSAGVNPDNYSEIADINYSPSANIILFFATSRKDLTTSPYYKPDITYTKSSLDHTSELNTFGTRTEYTIDGVDNGDYFIIEYEVAFRDTGRFQAKTYGINTIECCNTKCTKFKGGLNIMLPCFKANSLSEAVGDTTAFLNNEKCSVGNYVVYVKP